MPNLHRTIIRPSVSTVTELKTIDTTNYNTGIDAVVMTGYGTSAETIYIFNKTSTATADDDLVVAPTTGGGRWLKVASFGAATDTWDRVTGATPYLIPHVAADNLGVTGTRIAKMWAISVNTNVLNVDNILIDLNDISSISGNINIIPVLGSATILDQHFSFDGPILTAITDNNTTITAYAGKNITIESVTIDGGVVAGVTSLTVDNILLDLNTISTTSGALNLTPFAGSAIVLDSHFSFDGTTMTAITDNNTTFTAYAGKNITIESVTFDGGVVAAITTLSMSSTLTNSSLNTANGIVQTDGSGIFSTGTNLPTATTIGTAYIYRAAGTDIPLADGGTNASLTASNGGIFYSTGSAGAILSGTATALQVLLSGSNTTPAWSTATYPATTTINQILYSSAANTITGLASAASSILVTDGSSVPSLATDIPTAVTLGTAYIYRVGGTDVAVTDGGTGLSAWTQYGLVYASTTTALSQVTDTTAGKVLITNTSAAPSFSDTPTLTTSLTTPLILGGTANTSNLSLRGTSHGTPTTGGSIILDSDSRLGLQISGVRTITDTGLICGLYQESSFSPTVSTNTAADLYFYPNFSPGTGVTITNAAGLWIATGGQSGAGTVTNGFGLYIVEPSYGTNKYGAFIGGNSMIFGTGTVKTTRDLLELRNYGNATDMDATGTALKFSQTYYDIVAPGVITSAKITAFNQGNWTSTPSTQNSYMEFSLATDGGLAPYFWMRAAGLTQYLNTYWAQNLYYVGGWKYVGNGYAGYIKVDVTGNIEFGTAANNTSGAGAAANPTAKVMILNAGNVGINAVAPQVKGVVCGTSAAYAGGSSNGIFQINTGAGGDAEEAILFGVLDGSNSWIQAAKPGTATRSLILNPSNGYVLIGGDGVDTTASAWLDISTTGNAKTLINALELTNRKTATDMDGTGVGIKANLWYYHASTPAVWTNGAGGMYWVAEQDATSTPSTQNSYCALYTTLNGTAAEKFRIDSAGKISNAAQVPTANSGMLSILASGANTATTGLLAQGISIINTDATADNTVGLFFNGALDTPYASIVCSFIDRSASYDSAIHINTAVNGTLRNILTIDNNGYVGLGLDNTIPSSPLDVRMPGSAGTLNTLMNLRTKVRATANTENAIYFEHTASDDGNYGSGMISTSTDGTWTGIGSSQNSTMHLKTVLAGVLGTKVIIDSKGNVGINALTFGTSAAGVLAIKNSTAPSTAADSAIQIYAQDSADNTSAFCLFSEQALEDIGTFTASKKLKMCLNGVWGHIPFDEI